MITYFKTGIVEILASAKCAGFNSGHIQCMLFTYVKKKIKEKVEEVRKGNTNGSVVYKKSKDKANKPSQTRKPRCK